MANRVRMFPPNVPWTDEKRYPTELANGWMRAMAIFAGAVNGTTFVAQDATSVGGAVTNTAATNVAPYGYATQAQADEIVARINEIRTALVQWGILV
jgi:hypothetical protein